MRKLFLSFIFGAIATMAFASDLPVKAQSVAPTATPAISWTGVWVGVTAGYGWSDQGIGISGGSALSQSLLNHGFYPSTINVERNGGTLGLRVGYDYQFMPNVVAGVVGAYSYSGMRGTASGGGNLVGVAYDENIKNIWDVLGRVGYLTPNQRAMIYVIGGYTNAQVNSTVTSAGLACGFSPFVVCPSGATSSNVGGYSIGGGLEYRMDRNLSLSVEYLYTDLGNVNTPVSMSVGKTGLPFTNNEAVKFNRSQIGLSYRF